MTRLCAVAICLAGTGCPGRQTVQCVDDSNCDLAVGGTCVVNPATGNRWCGYPDLDCESGLKWSDVDIGDDIAGTCIAPVMLDPYIGGYAFVSRRDLDAEIYVMAVDGSAQKALTNDPGEDLEPRWSPDGTRIAFVSTRSGVAELYEMAADGSEVASLSNGDAHRPAWSPDGTTIAFDSVRSGDKELYVVRVDAPVPTRVTFGGGGAPAWSPDGTRLAFERHNTIAIANADGSGAHVITPGPDSDPAWDPTGSRLAYAHADTRDAHNIYIVAVDGGGTTVLTHGGTFDLGPAWSPDGTRIAFIAGVDLERNVWVASVDGASVALIGPADQSDAPVWTADGGSVVFAASGDGDREIVRVGAAGGTAANLTNHAGDDDGVVSRPR